MNLFITSWYLGFNLASALAALVAAYQWYLSAIAARNGEQAAAIHHNALAAWAACVAAAGQAAVALKAFGDHLSALLGL